MVAGPLSNLSAASVDQYFDIIEHIARRSLLLGLAIIGFYHAIKHEWKRR